MRNRKERHIVYYLNGRDIEVVRNRLPDEVKTRLRDVFIRRTGDGVRTLGAVKLRGRRDIVLIGGLPPRVSLRGFVDKGQSPLEFGAPERGQWPPWTVCRFLLYDVFLHELGHLQKVSPKAKLWERRFAYEPEAREFAAKWRGRLWSSPFGGSDPVHDPPGQDELETIELWERLDKKQRYKLVESALWPWIPLFVDDLGSITERQRRFLSQHAGLADGAG